MLTLTLLAARLPSQSLNSHEARHEPGQSESTRHLVGICPKKLVQVCRTLDIPRSFYGCFG